METKRCSKCGEVKPRSEFNKSRREASGLQSSCKMCRKIWRESHKAETAECRKVWRENHKSERETYQKTWRSAHKAHIVEYGNKYSRENPEKLRATKLRRRARKCDALGFADAKQIQARWNYYGGRCYICGVIAEAVDHVIPLARGGTNWPANLKPICNRCNWSKGAKWPYDFEKFRQKEEER